MRMVVLAGVLNALTVVGKKKQTARLALIGAGAANIAVIRILIAAGFAPQNMLMVDTLGLLCRDQSDLGLPHNEFKLRIAELTNQERKSGGIAEALNGADLCISLAKSGPGVIKPEWITKMARDPIVFACANPLPEIWPWEAKEAGARIVATGRSDFPNQVNNSLGFPAIFAASSMPQQKQLPTKCVSPPLKSWRAAPRRREFPRSGFYRRWMIENCTRARRRPLL